MPGIRERPGRARRPGGDGLSCTGTEICDAALDCQASGDPCAPGELCDEAAGSCQPALVFADGSATQRLERDRALMAKGCDYWAPVSTKGAQ